MYLPHLSYAGDAMASTSLLDSSLQYANACFVRVSPDALSSVLLPSPALLSGAPKQDPTSGRLGDGTQEVDMSGQRS